MIFTQGIYLDNNIQILSSIGKNFKFQSIGVKSFAKGRILSSLDQTFKLPNGASLDLAFAGLESSECRSDRL